MPPTSFCCRAGVRCVAALNGNLSRKSRLEFLVSWRRRGQFSSEPFMMDKWLVGALFFKKPELRTNLATTWAEFIQENLGVDWVRLNFDQAKKKLHIWGATGEKRAKIISFIFRKANNKLTTAIIFEIFTSTLRDM